MVQTDFFSPSDDPILAADKARFAVRPVHLVRGAAGELAAKKHLQKAGLKFLAANYRSRHGESISFFATQLFGLCGSKNA